MTIINFAIARAMSGGNEDREREILEEMLDRERESENESKEVEGL